MLAERPLPATVEFAFFTAEESGLLGSAEYARRAVVQGKAVTGVINNDMIGYTNDHRPDMTIRWSGPGVRDVMHGAAIFFTDLITYDARYYRNTDAVSLNDTFGDIVSGMGAYPVLGNPHYHQLTDRVDTVNQRLVAEACKVTVAAIMALASSPAPVSGVTTRQLNDGSLQVTWTSAAEQVREYVVRYTDRAGALREARVAASAAPDPRGSGGAPTARLADLQPRTSISIKAVTEQGVEGWDWATVQSPRYGLGARMVADRRAASIGGARPGPR